MPTSVADGDLVQWAAEKESTYATHPGGTMQKYRYTSEGVAAVVNTVESELVTGDRQVGDLVKTSESAAGPFETELSYGEYDEWMEGVMHADATWTTPASDVTSVSADSGANKFVKSGGWGTLAANDWIRTTGFATAANNDYWKVSSVSGDDAVVVGGTVTTEGAVGTARPQSEVVNGTTTHSWVHERTYTDLASELVEYLGAMFNTMSLRITIDEIVQLSFGILAKHERSITSSGGGGYTAAATVKPFNAQENVVKFLENNASFQSTEMSLEINNGLEGLRNIGDAGFFDIASGTFVVNGNLRQFYTSKAIHDKAINNTLSKLAIVLKDEDGNAYVFDMPSVRFTPGSRSSGGRNTRVVADIGFQAVKDTTEGVTLRIIRFAA
jgi:hypothetical protein